MDDFITLSNRLLTRCPNIGFELSKQFVNDAWHTLQSMQEWSWRRRSGVFAPPNQYSVGQVSTNVAAGAPTLITGVGTNWTPDMIGRQIRLGGLLYPFYTIVGWQSPTAVLLDTPWAGPDVAGQTYMIIQAYYPLPADFGYFYAVISIQDAFRLTTLLTQADLAVADPQRTNFGQTYAAVFKDFIQQYGGVVGPVVPVTRVGGPTPISTTTNGFTFVANATYIVQVVAGGPSGTATFQWMRAGSLVFQPPDFTSDQPQDLSDGVQIYWPDGINYIPGDLFIINCVSNITQGVQRVELWPNPTYDKYLYPYIYIAAEGDLTQRKPQLPPPIAARGEILLEMALEKCASFPGPDTEHPNPYYNLKQIGIHAAKAADMLVDLVRNDDEVTIGSIDYQSYPYYGAPWLDANWQQRHAPFPG